MFSLKAEWQNFDLFIWLVFDSVLKSISLIRRGQHNGGRKRSEWLVFTNCPPSYIKYNVDPILQFLYLQFIVHCKWIYRTCHLMQAKYLRLSIFLTKRRSVCLRLTFSTTSSNFSASTNLGNTWTWLSEVMIPWQTEKYKLFHCSFVRSLSW